MKQSSGQASDTSPGEVRKCGLRLYVAAGTPNSVRAEQNLRHALLEMGSSASRFQLKIIDVFKHAKRALSDGVIVTPTLIGLGSTSRVVMMGDLTDGAKLAMFLRGL